MEFSGNVGGVRGKGSCKQAAAELREQTERQEDGENCLPVSQPSVVARGPGYAVYFCGSPQT